MAYVQRKSKKHNREMLKLMGNLYGDKSKHPWRDDNQPKPKVKKVNTTPSEDDEQIRLVVWLKKKGILFFHVPNGSHKSQAAGAHFKRLGLQPGVPDIIIPMAKNGFHGLAIELKRVKGGVLTESQTYWLEQLRHEGWKAEMCKGADKAIELVEEYMALVV